MNVATEKVIEQAVKTLRQGGIIAYPTEYCFGLGCDPNNEQAIERILNIKHRQADQGLILIAHSLEQLSRYVVLESSPYYQTMLDTWPGATTWVLPAQAGVSKLVSGKHNSVAVRLPDHRICQQLCVSFNDAIVSTSANRHGAAALLSAEQVAETMDSEIDYIINSPVGDADKPSTILSGITGERFR